HGRGVDHDYGRARLCFEQAAGQSKSMKSQAHAQKYLGDIYFEGLGVVKDFKKAAAYYEQAAEQTGDSTMSNSANKRLEEVHVILANQTYASACRLFKKKLYLTARSNFEKVENGPIDASKKAVVKRCLGEIYYYGHFVLKDVAKARSLFETVVN